MSLSVKVRDGDSVVTLSFKNDRMTISSPTKELTPALEALSRAACECAVGEDNRMKILEHVLGSKSRKVLVGKDMCG